MLSSELSYSTIVRYLLGDSQAAGADVLMSLYLLFQTVPMSSPVASY